MEEFKVHKVGGIGGHTLKKLENPCLEFERCQLWGTKCSGEHQNGHGVVRENETACVWGRLDRFLVFFHRGPENSSQNQPRSRHISRELLSISLSLLLQQYFMPSLRYRNTRTCLVVPTEPHTPNLTDPIETSIAANGHVPLSNVPQLQIDTQLVF